MKENLRILLSGGGTGGHIYPAIAIADELLRRYPKAKIHFVGAKDRMEMQKVPQAGYKITGLWISGIQRKISFKNLLFPFKLLSSLGKCRKIIKEQKPHVVIGTGGFASGPLLRVANSAKIPTLIQEQNSFPGITNRILSKNTQVICAAYEEVKRFFPAEKTVITGNPVRRDVVNREEAKKEEALSYFNLKPEKQILLVLGGSLGARRINQLVEEYIPKLTEKDIQIIWQTGKLYYAEYKKYHGATIKVYEYLDRMDLAYTAASLIISRAGAGSVSELCIVGKPVIFIPSPNVAEDHQAKNALSLSKDAAALTIKENELENEFEAQFFKLLSSKEEQKKLGDNIKKRALPHATSAIVDEVEKLIQKSNCNTKNIA